MFDLHRPFHYYRCQNCHSLFQHPMPDTEEIADFYPNDYSIYDERTRSRKIGVFRSAILRYAKGYQHLNVPWFIKPMAGILTTFKSVDTPEFVPQGRLLDVGCGNGRYLSTMRTLGWQVQGVEFSAEGVRVCRMENLPVHHGDLVSAEFPDDAFDLIMVGHVIEHIPSPHAFMSELARVLRPRGKVVIETPNAEALGRTWFGANWYANDVPRHLLLFSADGLQILAKEHGLECLTVEQKTSAKIVLNSIDYAIGNQGTVSKKVAWRRFLARLYVRAAKRKGRGDSLRLVFHKP